MDSVSGDRDDLFLDLDVVDFIVEVEGDVLSLGSLDGLHSHVDIAVDDLQVAGLDELIALGESHIAGVDVNGVVGDRDDLFLDLDVVDFIVEVEGDVLSLGSLDGLHSHVDIAVDDLQVAGLDELIALGESHIAGVDVNGVVGDRDDIFLDLDVVDLIIEVEGNLLFSRCSALTVQHDGRILRGDPLNTVVGQVKEHRVPGHAGVLLGIPVLDVLLHIGLGVKLDHIHVALDAQAVSLRRVAAVQQAGGDGLMALGGAVHLEVPQENLQSVIRGGDSADLDGGNAVLVDVHIARLSYLVAVGNLLGGDFAGVDLVRVSRDFHGVGVAHLRTGYHIHKLDGDIVRDALEHRSKGNIAFTLIPEHMRKHIGQSGSRGQCAGGITIVLPLDKLIAALRDGIQDGIVGVILLRHGYGVIVYIR